MKRQYLFLLASALIISGCSKESQDQARSETAETTTDTTASENKAAADAAPESSMAAPGIPTSVAPNLAFEYQYRFKLPDEKISAVQSEHAAACDMLGMARCQVVDMKYQQTENKNAEAMLAFKLDPAIARKFGSDAIASVEKAKGVLADGNVTGTNVGGQIEDSQGRSALLSAQLDRLEKRLAGPGLSTQERASLQDRAEELRKELDVEQDGRRQGEAQIAMTPVVFTYTSDGGVPGFGSDNPFADAANVSATSFATMVSFVLLVVGAVAPWAILIVALMLLWRSNMMRSTRAWFARNNQAATVATVPISASAKRGKDDETKS